MADESDSPKPAHGYLVVVDETPESKLALRFASRRAVNVGGKITLLNVLPQPEFMQWGGVQEMIEAEAREKAEALLVGIADQVLSETGLRPSIAVRQGKATDEVMELISTDPTIHALVLGAASKGSPGPLVTFFSGEAAGQLPCLVMIVPGGLSEEALDRLA